MSHLEVFHIVFLLFLFLLFVITFKQDMWSYIKAIPLQAWTDPLGSRSLRLPVFLDSQHMKAVRLSALLRIIYLKRNHFSGVYNVVAVLYLQILVHVMLFLMVNVFFHSTFRSTCAVPIVAFFCSSVVLYFPGMLLRYFLNDFEFFPFAPVSTGITFCFYMLLLLLLLFIMGASSFPGVKCGWGMLLTPHPLLVLQ